MWFHYYNYGITMWDPITFQNLTTGLDYWRRHLCKSNVYEIHINKSCPLPSRVHSQAFPRSLLAKIVLIEQSPCVKFSFLENNGDINQLRWHFSQSHYFNRSMHISKLSNVNEVMLSFFIWMTKKFQNYWLREYVILSGSLSADAADKRIWKWVWLALTCMLISSTSN